MDAMPSDVPMRLSQSFGREEVLVVCRILEVLRRGGDPGDLIERPEAVEALRRFMRMRARILRAEPDVPPSPPSPPSSVGLAPVGPWRPGYLAG